MAARSRPKRAKVRGKPPKTHFVSGLEEIVSRRSGSGASTILGMTRLNTWLSKHASA